MDAHLPAGLAVLEERTGFARLDAVDRGLVRRVRRAIPRPHETEATVAWCIEHAIIHAGEHWGQIQLNRSLFLHRAGS
jgi:hypothetical protein